MKKWKIWIFAASLVLLTGCSKEAAETETKTETAAAVEIETEAQPRTQTQADSIPAETLTPAQTLAESEASSENSLKKHRPGIRNHLQKTAKNLQIILMQILPRQQNLPEK